jgi:4-hydroxy-2-oxoheptanedioate aldolase
MTAQDIKRVVAENKRVYGTLVTSPSPLLVSHIKATGVDFVFIDTEHIPLGPETLASLCTAYNGEGIAPIVRIPSPDPYAATRAIDFGARGIVAPYVETPEEVQRLRGAVKYRPLKGDRLEAFLFGGEKLEPELSDYLQEYNRQTLLFINIESEPACRNLETLLDVPDLDGILIGPHDLSCSIGLPEQYTSPSFTRALEHVVKNSRARELITGVHFSMCGNLSLASKWLDMGINMYIHQADIFFASAGLCSELRSIQEQLGEELRFFPPHVSF